MFIDKNLTICSPIGFKASGIHCGLKKNLLKKDLALIYSDVVASSFVFCTSGWLL